MMYADPSVKSIAERWNTFQAHKHCNVRCREIWDDRNVAREFKHVHILSKTLVATPTHVFGFGLGVEYERHAAGYTKRIVDSRILLVVDVSAPYPCSCDSTEFVRNLPHVYESPVTHFGLKEKLHKTALMENVLFHKDNPRWISESQEMRSLTKVITLLDGPKLNWRVFARETKGSSSTIDDDDCVLALGA